MAPFLTWLQAALLPSFPSATSLPLLELAYHVKVSRKLLLQTIVLTAEVVDPRGAPTIIMQAHQCTHHSPEKKKDATPAECWDLQQIVPTRLCRVQTVQYLPKSW